MYEASKTTSKQKLYDDIKKAVDNVISVIVFDKQGTIQYVNDQFNTISEYPKEKVIGCPMEDYFPDDLIATLKEKAKKNEKWSGETKQKKKNGTSYWVKSHLISIPKDNENTNYILLQHEITEHKMQEQILEELAYIDPLTGLANRNYIDKRIREYDLLEKEMTIFLIDIDSFKSINDNFGHDIGDKVLIAFSDRLKNYIGDDSPLFRYDGEEFIILLEDQSSEDINLHLQQILEILRHPILIENHEILLKVSIGISTGKPSPVDKDALSTIRPLINEADTALYLAKKQGGNRFHFYSKNDSRQLERAYQIELELREALERDEFSMVYQPLINLKTNKIVGVESLLRWNNRLLGNVSPAEFIPTLEETGLIVPVGKWILQAVCQQMKGWQDQGLFLQRVSLNVSPVQFRESNFTMDLKEILHEVELEPSYLEIEITEGTLLDIDNSAKKLHDLQELGVKVSIDDFGTGYSSLSYLKQLPIDTLKIDKSFIDDLDRDGKIIVNTIISMGKNLQFRVIAEGIENSDQFKYLQEQECHEGQGYFFSHPVESSRVEELYHSLQ